MDNKDIQDRIVQDIYSKCFIFNEKRDIKFVKMNVGLDNILDNK